MVARARARFLNACIKTYFFILNRLQEASTMRGIIATLAGLVTWIKPEQVDSIVAIALVLIGVVGVITPDSLRKRERTLEKRTEEASK
jgi:intracellular septation protein A